MMEQTRYENMKAVVEALLAREEGSVGREDVSRLIDQFGKIDLCVVSLADAIRLEDEICAAKGIQ